MGRGKLNMELIRNERSRMLTFKKRKEGLMKKLHQLTTLCDVGACMIIYGPTQENRAVGPEIWPQNPDEVHRMIGVHKSKTDDSVISKSFGLSDFFHERKRKVEEELAKLRKENVEAKYPTWDEFLNFLSEAELRALAVALNNKAQIVKSRLEFLKREKQESDMMKDMMMMMDFTSPNLSQFYTLNHDQEINPIYDMGFMNQISTGNNIHYAPQVVQPVPPPPYMQWPMISVAAAAPPAGQLQMSSNENLNYQDDGGADADIIQYLLQFN